MPNCPRDDDGTKAEQDGEIKPGVVSQRKMSGDQQLIFASVLLVNMVSWVTLLEMKMISNKVSTLAGSGYLYLCFYMCWNEKLSSYSLLFLCVRFEMLWKSGFNFVGLLICAKPLIFQGPCTIIVVLENRKTVSEQKLWCQMKGRTLGLLRMWASTYRPEEQSALCKGMEDLLWSANGFLTELHPQRAWNERLLCARRLGQSIRTIKVLVLKKPWYVNSRLLSGFLLFQMYWGFWLL